jgi:phage terminase small subunit
MPRPAYNWEAVRRDYETTNLTLAEVAKKHDIPVGSVKPHCASEKWAKHKEQPSQPVEVKKTTVVVEKVVKVQPRVVSMTDSSAAQSDDELTTKQRRFVEEYLVDANATQAAIRSGYSPKSADVNGPRLLGNARVAAAIAAGLAAQKERLEIEADDVVKEWTKIGFADITKFLSFRTEKTQVGTDKEGNPIFGYRQVIEMKSSDQVDGTMIAEVSISPKGVFSFKLHDKMKALEDLARRFKLFDGPKRGASDEQIEKLLAQMEAAANAGIQPKTS